MSTSETQTPTLGQVIRDAISNSLVDVHTATWGRVESYDSATQRASVQIIPRRGYVDEFGERRTERLPVLPSVPVMFLGSGSFSLTWPIKTGDVVLLVFMETSTDTWLTHAADDTDPLDDRRHSLNDAIAIPGLRSVALPSANVSGTAMVITATEIHAGGTSPLVTRAEFMDHVHATPSGGGPSDTPTISITGTTVLKGG